MTQPRPIARSRQLAAPIAAGAGLAGALAVLHFHDPHVPGAYGVCPFHGLTGLWCPGCGGLRAVNALTNGELAQAFSSNIFAPIVLVIAAMALGYWFTQAVRQRPVRVPRIPNALVAVVVAAIVAFTVARNTPWGMWLAP